MADYDSDSSAGADDIETNVLLGYVSHEPTGDDFSQLGGRPTWLDGKTAPSGAYAKCKVCRGTMSLLLQLNGDLPDWFPGHERRLYVFGCRRKPCRRKEGSISALRAVRVSQAEDKRPAEKEKTTTDTGFKPPENIGDALFGVKSQSPQAQLNPFSSKSSTSPLSNPFSSQQPALIQPTATEPESRGADLPETYAQKARIASSTNSTPAPPLEPWSEDSAPYPSYFLDADKEYLEPEPEVTPSNATLDTEGGPNGGADDKVLFESTMDKTFQRFADRLNQNPEQVLRYEFAGQPLLYSKDDTVGKLLSPTQNMKVQTSSTRNGNSASGTLRIPRCTSCGATRVFEMQLTPQAITELEVNEIGINGMDWGTIIVGVCSGDCGSGGRTEEDVVYSEEWVGVQWEEIVGQVKK